MYTIENVLVNRRGCENGEMAFTKIIDDLINTLDIHYLYVVLLPTDKF